MRSRSISSVIAVYSTSVTAQSRRCRRHPALQRSFRIAAIRAPCSISLGSMTAAGQNELSLRLRE